MPEIPDVTPGGTIQTAWGNQIRDRAVMRYASAAARDASVLVPVSGDLAWLDDVNELTIFNALVWQVHVRGNHNHAGNIIGSQVPGVEDLTSGSFIPWPSNLSTTFTVPDGMTRLYATAVISQAEEVTGGGNHEIGLGFNAVVSVTTRIRFPIDQTGNIVVTIGGRNVSPGQSITLQTEGRRISGSGALRIDPEKLSFIDYRFGVV